MRLAILNDLRREWKAYLRGRLWAFAILLALLGALALIQYHWINQVAEAERQRAKADLAAALSNVESDFDIEITRAFAVFEAPAANLSEYSERYRQWLRFAPYPGLVRGVYIVDERNPNEHPKIQIVGGPAIPPREWQEILARRAVPVSGATFAGSVGSEPGLQVFSQAGVMSSGPVLNPAMTVDGNPALVFPIPPVFAAFEDFQNRGPALLSRSARLAPASRPAPFPRWGLIVLDAAFIRNTLLPGIVKVRFPKAGSEFDIVVVDQTAPARPRVVFQSDSAPGTADLGHTDASSKLFQVRMDCFLPSSSISEARILTSTEGARVHVLTSAGEWSEALTRRATACGSALPPGGHPDGLWDVLVRYRAGSLDQAMANFRQKNLLLGGGVVFVLAVGILALIAFAERARALAQMQTEFVLGVSHELRTPLTVIRLAADNLEKGMVGNSDEARKYGQIVTAHASELSNMIEETLAFARIQSTALVPRTAPVPPEQIVKASLANCERVLDEAGVELELEFAPALPLVAVDARLMIRCLENLVQNAAKYAAAGRWVAVRTSKVSNGKGDWVRISVEDRGPGISRVDFPRIFEAFYRGSQAEASQVPGVGLGLALVKRTVESHRGKVEVQSFERGGTTFSVFLPAHPDTREAART